MDGLTIALEVIQEYIDEFLFEPGKNWPDYEFNKRSDERWAAKELMLYLETHWGETNAVNLIARFIREMDAYSGIREDTPPSFKFILARETAEEILYLFV